MNSLKENSTIRILLNIIVGVALFQILFGLVFYGSAATPIQSLILIVAKLVKVIIVVAVLAGALLALNKAFGGKGEGKLMNFNRDQVIKGVIIGILALIAGGLLSNLFNGTGTNYGAGYYGHGGEGVPYAYGYMYGYNGGNSLSGLVSNILSLLITLMSVALVVFLSLGIYKVAWPYLNAEIANFVSSSPKNKCAKCGKELSADWQLCPYCGTYTARLIEATVQAANAASVNQEAVNQESINQEPVTQEPSTQKPTNQKPANQEPTDRKPADRPEEKPNSKKPKPREE